ncbi:MAG: insulinase family protein [Anaerolineales bacterium]|nr:insulinase family protein [Anaerolineales bacterium]
MKRVLILLAVVTLVLSGCRPVQSPAATSDAATGPASNTAEADLEQPLSTDPAVRIGQLDNGLTYYIRVNHEPKQRAQLWLAINAGSVLEDDDQKGLAHFLEHMLFNGTEEYPKQALIDYLESLGVQFGPDLNAYTSFDETVYMLQTPTDLPELLPKGLDVLSEWAHAALIDPTEVDNERGVIVEEWRLRDQTAQGRIIEALVPTLLAGSKYAERLPIGDMDIIRSAPAETLRRFYETWYRPDNMAVIAVGDFDPDQVEQQIKEKFGALPATDAPIERPTIDVPAAPGDNYLIVTDPETQYAEIEILHRVDTQSFATTGDFQNSLVESLVGSMLNMRFMEIAQQAGTPILYGGSGRSSLVRSADNYVAIAITPEDKIQEGLAAVATEVERVIQHGFTATELERAKTDVLRSFQQQYDQRETTPSDYFTSDYARSFLNGDAIPSIEDKNMLAQELLPGITLEMVNATAQTLMPAKDRLVLLIAPEKEGLTLPTEAELKQTIDAATGRQVAAYADTTVDRPLVAEAPPPAKIISERELPDVGATEIELENGVRVVMKPTDFDKAQVIFRGASDGGASLTPDDQYATAASAADITQFAGIADFSLTDLQKLLTGKVVSVSPFIGELSEGFNGRVAPTDLETALQLVYLYATQPRFDENALKVYQDQMRTVLQNRSLDPESALEDAFLLGTCGDSIRCNVLPVSEIDGLKLDTVEKMYRDRFANLGDSTFVFVGNFDPAQLKDLAQRYLGNLPSTGAKEQWQDAIQEPEIKPVDTEIRKGKGDRADVELVYRGAYTPTLESDVRLSALDHLLNIRLREVIREEMSGSYAPYSMSASWDKPDAGYQVVIRFTTDPKRVTELLPVAHQLVDELRTTATSDLNLTKVKEQMLRSHELDLRDNNYWRSILTEIEENPERLEDPATYAGAVNASTAEDIRATASALLNPDSVLQIVMVPENIAP